MFTQVGTGVICVTHVIQAFLNSNSNSSLGIVVRLCCAFSSQFDTQQLSPSLTFLFLPSRRVTRICYTFRHVIPAWFTYWRIRIYLQRQSKSSSLTVSPLFRKRSLIVLDQAEMAYLLSLAILDWNVNLRLLLVAIAPSIVLIGVLLLSSYHYNRLTLKYCRIFRSILLEEWWSIFWLSLYLFHCNCSNIEYYEGTFWAGL